MASFCPKLKLNSKLVQLLIRVSSSKLLYEQLFLNKLLLGMVEYQSSIFMEDITKVDSLMIKKVHVDVRQNT